MTARPSDLHTRVASELALAEDGDEAVNLAIVLLAIILREAPPEQRAAVAVLLTREALDLLAGRP